MNKTHAIGTSLPLFATFAIALALLSGPADAQAPRTPSPEGAKVYFIEPNDGATISGPVKVVMGLSGMGVAPAGVAIDKTGHHHIMVNVDPLPPMDGPLPANDQFRHFGGGQTETTINLPAGTHTLQLLLGDMNHVPHDPPIVSERITITVSQ